MADTTQPSSLTSPAPEAVRAAPQTPPSVKASRLGFLKLSFKEIAVLLLIINLGVLAALFLKIEANKPQQVATVSVSQLSTIYETELAKDPTNTPEMIKIKTNMFMAMTQKAIENLAAKDHRLILVRECVLTGEHEDMTQPISEMVSKAVQQNQAAAAADPTLGAFNATIGH